MFIQQAARPNSFLVQCPDFLDEQVGWRFCYTHLRDEQGVSERLRRLPKATSLVASPLPFHRAFPEAWSFVPRGMNFLLCCFVSGTLPSVCCGRKVWVWGQLGLGYGHPCMAIFLPAQASGGHLQSSILVAFDLCEPCLPKMR